MNNIKQFEQEFKPYFVALQRSEYESISNSAFNVLLEKFVSFVDKNFKVDYQTEINILQHLRNFKHESRNSFYNHCDMVACLIDDFNGDKPCACLTRSF